MMLLAVFSFVGAWAEEASMIVWLTDGTKTEVLFDEMPELTYDEGTITMKSKSLELSWPLAKLDRVTFNAFVLPDTKDNAATLVARHASKCQVSLNRTLLTGSYNTFAAPFDVSAEQFAAVFGSGAKAKELTASAFESGVLTMTFADATSLKAGKPYLIKVPADVVNPVFENVTINQNATTTTTSYVDFVPTLGKTLVKGSADSEDDVKSVLILGPANKLYYPSVVNDAADEASYIKGFRAFFQLHDGAVGAQIRFEMGDEDATAIMEVEGGQWAVGSSERAWFTLDGRKLIGKPTQKGVYIRDNQKVVIK